MIVTKYRIGRTAMVCSTAGFLTQRDKNKSILLKITLFKSCVGNVFSHNCNKTLYKLITCVLITSDLLSCLLFIFIGV